MFKITIKRYGYPRWNGVTPTQSILRESLSSLDAATAQKLTNDKQDFMTSLKTVKSTAIRKSSDAEWEAGVSWVTEILVENEREADDLVEFTKVKTQERLNLVLPGNPYTVDVIKTKI
jgi:hypothetical protein